MVLNCTNPKYFPTQGVKALKNESRFLVLYSFCWGGEQGRLRTFNFYFEQKFHRDRVRRDITYKKEQKQKFGTEKRFLRKGKTAC